MKIVLISDTHLTHLKYQINVPECDLLIHSGDALCGGNEEELQLFSAWFGALPAKRKVFVAGNHDRIFEKRPDEARKLLPKDVIYLQDELVEVDGLKIYGSPWQPEFFEWAFNLPRGRQLAEKWARIPAGIDILVTHGPPMGVLDWSEYSLEHVGCEDMRRELARVKPRLHVFGHIHGGYGTAVHAGTTFVNASICDESYRPSHEPVVVEILPGQPVSVLLPSGRAGRPVTPIRRTNKPLWS
jgi:Icc-related predicted phosphoesterase